MPLCVVDLITVTLANDMYHVESEMIRRTPASMVVLLTTTTDGYRIKPRPYSGQELESLRV